VRQIAAAARLQPIGASLALGGDASRVGVARAASPSDAGRRDGAGHCRAGHTGRIMSHAFPLTGSGNVQKYRPREEFTAERLPEPA
jgi:hypothetical protein